MRVLTLRDYDYLDFRNESFDKDYVEFLSRMDSVTEKLQHKLENTYNGVWDTPHAFQYLARSAFLPFPPCMIYLQPRFEKLKNVLHVEDMESKHKRMINCFN